MLGLKTMEKTQCVENYFGIRLEIVLNKMDLFLISEAAVFLFKYTK